MTDLNKNKKEQNRSFWDFDLWDMFASSKPYFLRRSPLDSLPSGQMDKKHDPLGYYLDKGMSIAVAAVVSVFCIGASIVGFCIIYGYFFPVK
jgi:hypothetical protein